MLAAWRISNFIARLKMAGNPEGLAVSEAGIRKQLLRQVDDGYYSGSSDPWGFGVPWAYGDTTSHGAGLSVMASEAVLRDWQTRVTTPYAQRWLANILGTNSWGSSFIVGDGSTFPNCIQHQVANLAGALDGTAGGTPILGARRRGASQLYHFRRGRRYDPLPRQWGRYVSGNSTETAGPMTPRKLPSSRTMCSPTARPSRALTSLRPLS